MRKSDAGLASRRKPSGGPPKEATQQRFADQIDGYVQAFLESMARAGNPGSTPHKVPVRLWPSERYWNVRFGREWVYSLPAASLRREAGSFPSSELVVGTNGTWNASHTYRWEPQRNTSAARDFDGQLTSESIDPSFVDWVLMRLTQWLRENGVPLPT
jgi:hypothetical protein